MNLITSNKKIDFFLKIVFNLILKILCSYLDDTNDQNLDKKEDKEFSNDAKKHAEEFIRERLVKIYQSKR